MADINLVVLSGHVGQDPEISTLSSGAQKAAFSIATSKKWTSKDGEQKEDTQWHRIEAWAGLAKLSEYIKKGYSVTVTGEIRYESYTDKEGRERDVTKIIAREISIGTKGDGSVKPQQPRQPSAAAIPGGQLPVGSDDDDLPF